ncbi:MAG: NUDIX domain-containing protein [Chloroflexota bacterium]
MAKFIYGDRIGKEAKLQIGSSAVLFDETGEKVLLTRRADNGRWCLPGGGMDPGEEIGETCVREVLEETGLEVRIKKMIGVYSNPHYIVWYDQGSGDKVQIVSVLFEVELLGGELTLSDETTEFGYFSRDEIDRMDLIDNHVTRIDDAFAQQEAAFIH